MLKDFIDNNADKYGDQAGFHNDPSDYGLPFSLETYLIRVREKTSAFNQEWIHHHRHKPRLPQFDGRRRSLTTTLRKVF